jgi:integrase
MSRKPQIAPKPKKHARAHNEGTLFQRKDGRWITRIVVGTLPCGKPDKREIYCRTKPEAVEALKTLHKEINKRPDKRGGELFASFLMRWLDNAKLSQVRQNTWELYASDIKKHIIPELGETAIGDIETSQIQSLMNKMTAKGYSSSVLYRVRFIIGSCLRTALPDRILDRDPTIGVTLPPNTTKKKILFTAEQADRFVEVVSNSTSAFKGLLNVYWEAGGRISELLGLKWKSVLENGIRIENVSIRVKGGSADALPKNKSSNRIVKLTASRMVVINSQPKRTIDIEIEENGKTKIITKQSEYVFCTASGKPYSYANFRRQWNSWLCQAFGSEDQTKEERKAGKPKKPLVTVTPHALRHMQATRLIQAGWSIADVQERGGWASPKVLMEIYAAHSSEQRQLEMAKTAEIDFGCQIGCQNEKEPPTEVEDP